MYREMLSPNHKIKLPTVMNMLHVVGLSLALILFSNAFQAGLGIRWPGYIAYVLIGILVVLLYRREVNQWLLSIGEGYIRFFSKAGTREKLLVSMPVESVSFLAPLGETLPEKPYERFCRINGPQTPWLLIGKTETGAACRVIFCPSEEAIQSIKESIGEKAGE